MLEKLPNSVSDWRISRLRFPRSSSRSWLLPILLLTLSSLGGCSTVCPTPIAKHNCPLPEPGDGDKQLAAYRAGHDLPHYRRLIGYCWPEETREAAKTAPIED